MISTAYKIAVVQCYIHHLKGVEVDIIIPQTFDEAIKLEKAYKVAKSYFENN